MMRVINLFGGPGSGKSTTAAGVFAMLKMEGVVAELVTEYAKSLTYEGRMGALDCQPQVLGKQLWSQERLQGTGVEVIVTDSPLLLSCIYGPPKWITPGFKEYTRHCFRQFDNINWFIRRPAEYVQVGRTQTQEEARLIDSKILEELLMSDTLFLTADKHDAIARISQAYLRASGR